MLWQYEQHTEYKQCTCRKTPLTHRVETVTGVFYDVQEKQGLCLTFIPPASPVARFGTKAPLLSAAAQNYSTPKPELPLEGLSASSPWVGARAGGWAAVTDRPKSRTPRTSNDTK